MPEEQPQAPTPPTPAPVAPVAPPAQTPPTQAAQAPGKPKAADVLKNFLDAHNIEIVLGPLQVKEIANGGGIIIQPDTNLIIKYKDQ